MRAAIYTSPGHTTLLDAPDPEPGPDEVLIRLRACGVCGSDLHRIDGGHADPGVILGHEWTGEVIAVGPGVDRLKPGDRVMPGGGVPAPARWQQPPLPLQPGCTSNHWRYSAAMQGRVSVPGHVDQGAFATLLKRNQWSPGLVPASLDDVQAACIEPLGVAVHGVRMAEGNRTAVFGLGAIGLFVVQCLRAQGATTIVGIDPSPVRRALATSLGATTVIDPLTDDPVEGILDLTGGHGADRAFECAGAPGTLDQTMHCLRWAGTGVLIAVCWTDTVIRPLDWASRNVRLCTSMGSAMTAAAEMLVAGSVQVEAMAPPEQHYYLKHLDQALAAMRSGTAVKPIILYQR